MNISLSHIRFGVDFRKNEATILREFNKTEKREGGPTSGKAFLFVSTGRNQLLWIVNTSSVVTYTGLESEAIFSWKMRILNGIWNPLMLSYYASECGIKLNNFRTFESEFFDYIHRTKGPMRAKFLKVA